MPPGAALEHGACRHRLGGAEAERLAAARGAASASRRSPRAAFRRPPASASSTASALEKQGIDPLPFYNPPAERSSNPSCASEYPLASSRRRRATSSTRRFANLARFREFESEPHLELHPERRRGARHRRRRPGARVQRPRQLHAARARQRQAAPRRGGRAVGVVEEVRARRRQRERPHLAAHRRPGRRARRSTTAWWKSKEFRPSGREQARRAAAAARGVAPRRAGHAPRGFPRHASPACPTGACSTTA